MRALENDLVKQAYDQTGSSSEVESGRRVVNSAATAPELQSVVRTTHKRRHPKRVLGQYEGVQKTQGEAGNLWTKALLQETKRTDLPQEYRPNSTLDGLSNQLGVVQTAYKNYKNSKNKMDRMFVVGA